MKIFRVTGSIYSITPARLVDVLSERFERMKAKPRVFGYDVELINESFSLYINTMDEQEYNLHIDFTGSESDLNDLLLNIKNALLKTDASFDIGYFEQDEKGNQVSDDVEYFER